MNFLRVILNYFKLIFFFFLTDQRSDSFNALKVEREKKSLSL